MRRGGAAATAVLALAALIALSGCATTPTPTAAATPPPAFAGPANGTSLAPAPAPTATPVDAAGYLTTRSTDRAQLNGVEFDSADRNIHCGIFDPYYPEFTPPISGCVPDHYDFVFPGDSAIGPPNSVFLEGTGAATAKTTSDVEFAGQDSTASPRVNVLSPGTSITWSTVSCVAIDDGIQCTNTATSHGFFLSKVKYRLF